MKSKRVFLRPTLAVQQLGQPFPEVEDPDYLDGCWKLRVYVPGVDYADTGIDDLIGCVAKRLSDGVIIAAPDWRFCNKPEFEVLWLQKRRKTDVIAPIHGGSLGQEERSTAAPAGT